MFIPSLFKSIPQVFSGIGPGYGAPTDILISAVDPNYTELSLQGWDGIGSGAVDPSQLMCKMKDATHFTIEGSASDYRILVREWFAGFFRQPFQYGTVTIASGAITGNTAHGLALGSKAYVLWMGNESTRDGDIGAGLALTEQQVRPTVRLAGINIRADVLSADYAGAPGTVTVSYLLVDPK